jgi:hypothetical protein
MVVTHPENQLVPQHVNVPFPIHGGLWGQEVEGASATLAAKAAPDHNARRMLDVNDSTACNGSLESAAALSRP